MSINSFEALNAVLIGLETKYVLTTLAILADDYGRIKDFDSRKIEEICDLGPRTVSIALNELCKLQCIQFLDKDFLCLRLPHARGK